MHEPCSFPGSGEPWYLGQVSVQQDPKNAEAELIHGRWAMLAVAGAWGQEVGYQHTVYVITLQVLGGICCSSSRTEASYGFCL